MSRRRQIERSSVDIHREASKPLESAPHLVVVPSAIDMIRELTDHSSHSEVYEWEYVNDDGTITPIRQRHVTKRPSLLEQLESAVEQSSSTEDGSRPGFTSTPAASIDALDTLLRIDDEAARWVRQLGEDDKGGTTACVRLAAALAAGQTACSRPQPRKLCCVPHRVESDVRRWWTWARVTTGWDLAAWRPDNTCPLCGKRGGLRVRVAASSAVCVECWETWEPATLGLLAAHIKAENECVLPGCVRPPRKDGRCVEHMFGDDTAKSATVTPAPEVCPETPLPPVLRGLVPVKPPAGA